jgi:hypothetical protein
MKKSQLQLLVAGLMLLTQPVFSRGQAPCSKT